MSPLARLMVLAAICLGFSVGSTNAQHMNAIGARCREFPGTSDAVECLKQSLGIADGELNITYSQILGILFTNERNQLRGAQRLWLSYRDTTCAAERSLYLGGTGQGPAYLACMEAETRQRVGDLNAIYGWRVEKAKH
jgi:uncharacterized protein YecT (DUF1311 family)